ncbi:MAG: XRE family transcriptional regulator [Parapedobacter sp.]|nr:MAG: XRE family transcriptional regulator [Parapedobacter sp.]
MNSEVEKIEQYVIDFVRNLRNQHDLRQEDIANILDVKPSFIGNVESASHPAKYNLKHINKLADHFGLSPQDFLPKRPL